MKMYFQIAAAVLIIITGGSILVHWWLKLSDPIALNAGTEYTIDKVSIRRVDPINGKLGPDLIDEALTYDNSWWPTDQHP